MEFSAYDQRGRRKYLSSAENKRFLGVLGGMLPYERLLCGTLYYTGCRLSETLSLGPRAVEYDEGVVRVKSLKKRERIEIRRIPIPEELLESLKASEPQKEKFWNCSLTTAWRTVKTAMLLAEIQGIQACPKGLRHGFGVRCALAGIPVTQIQEWMGHASVETTSIYLDVKDAEERELMSRTWGDVR